MPETKKLKIADVNGASAALPQQKLVIRCKDGQVVVATQGQIDRLLEVEHFRAAYMGHFKENDGQLREDLTKEIAQLCIDSIFGEKLALDHPSISEVWVTLDRWGVDENDFFAHHPFKEGLNLMKSKELFDLYQSSCRAVLSHECRGGFTLVSPVASIFESLGVNEPSEERLGHLLTQLLKNNIVAVPTLIESRSNVRADEAFPDCFKKEADFKPCCRRKFNGTVPSCQLVGCRFVGKFNQTNTLFATINIIMWHMGKRYKVSRSDIRYSMNFDMVIGATAVMINTIKWDTTSNNDNDSDEDDPCSLGLLRHLSFATKQCCETLQLRHGKFQALSLIESQMREFFLKENGGWLAMPCPDSYTLGRFIRARQLSFSGDGASIIYFDPENCCFSIEDNVPEMLKIMAENRHVRSFIGVNGLLLVDFKQLHSEIKDAESNSDQDAMGAESDSDHDDDSF